MPDTIEDDYSSNAAPSEVTDEDNYYEDIKEDQQDDEDAVEAPTSIAKCNEPLFNERMYLRSINRNMELLIELNKRSQSMEKERTITLRQLLTAIKINTSWNCDDSVPRKKIKLSKSADVDNLESNENQYDG